MEIPGYTIIVELPEKSDRGLVVRPAVCRSVKAGNLVVAMEWSHDRDNRFSLAGWKTHGAHGSKDEPGEFVIEESGAAGVVVDAEVKAGSTYYYSLELRRPASPLEWHFLRFLSSMQWRPDGFIYAEGVRLQVTVVDERQGHRESLRHEVGTKVLSRDSLRLEEEIRPLLPLENQLQSEIGDEELRVKYSRKLLLLKKAAAQERALVLREIRDQLALDVESGALHGSEAADVQREVLGLIREDMEAELDLFQADVETE